MLLLLPPVPPPTPTFPAGSTECSLPRILFFFPWEDNGGRDWLGSRGKPAAPTTDQWKTFPLAHLLWLLVTLWRVEALAAVPILRGVRRQKDVLQGRLAAELG